MKFLVTGGGGQAAMFARAAQARASLRALVKDDQPDCSTMDGSVRHA